MVYDPRQVVEGLRSGVPYREMAKNVVFGRERSLAQVTRLLEAVEEGRTPKSHAYVVRANYGEGKTHLLHSVWGLAEERNWVVSQVSLSRETPLDRLDYLYPKIIENTYVPGSRQPGISRIVTAAMDEPHMLTEARSLDLSPRTMTLVDNLMTRHEGMSELIADIEGRFMSVAELKKIHRENFGKPLKLPRSSLKDEVVHYLRLVDWMIRRAGFHGWVILFDEVELIGKLGKAARYRAYANMGQLISDQLPHTVSVWAVASNFNSDVLLARNDRDEAAPYLQSRPKDEALAPFAVPATDALLEAKMLDPLTKSQVQELIGQIYRLHQDAYGWQASFSEEALYEQIRRLTPTQDTRVRTWVRLCLMVLDIWYQYGTEPTVSVLSALEEMDLAEAPELFRSASTTESDNADFLDGAPEDSEIPRPMLFRTPLP